MPLSKQSVLPMFFATLVIVFSAVTAPAQDESAETAEALMIQQMDAVKTNDHPKFIENGNKAFKEFMDAYMFDSLVMQRQAKLAKGYRLEYLGDIRSIGMRQHLWKVHITDDKYQLLGSLSLSHGKVVGFSLE